MTSNNELAALFGKDNVRTWDMGELRKIGLKPAAARILAEVGLPRNVPKIFTTQVAGDPPTFSHFEFPLGGKPAKILILGGPPGDTGARFFLDVYDDLVGLFSFSESSPRSEVVNATMEDFVTFLHLYGLHEQKTASNLDNRLEMTRDLARRLREHDALAFERSDGWWSAVLDHLQGEIKPR